MSKYSFREYVSKSIKIKWINKKQKKSIKIMIKDQNRKINNINHV